MDTKLKGDIAEQAAVLHALKRGWGVLKPVGDRLPYDLAFDVEGTLIKIQVKYAWFDEPSSNYVVDNRRTKTNRRFMLREAYKASDFDFALVYVETLDRKRKGYKPRNLFLEKKKCGATLFKPLDSSVGSSMRDF
ncbi:putative endonuclease [Scytonema sp. HK-05]|uniref:group I intron-associated PD-(D/E)XK endonuclease n=1 Tax=Scytonema sp. HK-05 TaxID=1137095 RepID=UPI000B2C676D|nr:group I intron-associated PD-(D/E)XK endonuclease [Scytonema sp. HK-05]BAY47090.1 putative endonuclease [Scytonema sp. HK-05]